MKFAITVSAYLMDDFVRLNLEMCKRIFPNSPLLVSDDISQRSPLIEAAASEYGAQYICSKKVRRHFLGDLQGVINSIVFARSQNCDIAVKISLRYILLDPSLRAMFEDRFTNHITNMILPSKVRPNQLIRRESMTFSQLPLLTDCILLRANAVEPQELIDHYRMKCTTEKAPHASLIEALFLDLAHGRFKDSTYISDELGVHQPGQPHRFLRKAQNNRVEYLDYAKRLGITGDFRTEEWSRLLGVHYSPKPRVI